MTQSVLFFAPLRTLASDEIMQLAGVCRCVCNAELESHRLWRPSLLLSCGVDPADRRRLSAKDGVLFFRTYRYPVAGVSVLTDRQANTRNIHAVPAHSRADPPWRVFLCWPKVLQRRRKRMRARRHRDRRTDGRADGQTNRQASKQAGAQDRPGATRNAHFPVAPVAPAVVPYVNSCRPLPSLFLKNKKSCS